MTRSANIVRNFRVAKKRIMAEVFAAAEEWTMLINRQVENITPMDTGAMRESQYLVKKQTVNGVLIETGFNTPYAPVVHEWPPDVNWTTPGTTNKFLQRPFYGSATTLPGYIVKRVRV